MAAMHTPIELSPALRRQLARLGLKPHSAPSSAGWAALLAWLDQTQGRAAKRQDSLDKQLAEAQQELARLQLAVNLAQDRLKSQLELSADWIWEQDAELRFTYVSDGIEAVAGIAAARLIGRKREFNVGFDMSAEMHEQYLLAVNQRRPYRDVVIAMTRPHDASRRHVRISAEPMFAADGEFLGYRGASRDITETVLADRKIQELARYDGLTGLPNRNMFMTELDAAIARSHRRSEPFALCFIDLDRFKTVNDTLGHDAGDELLRIMAARLRTCVRSTDLVARLGGDEFVMLLEASGGAADVTRVAQKVITAIGAAVPLQGLNFLVTGSVGVAMHPNDGADAASLLKNADAAMYLAKERGKNNVQFYTSALADEAVRQFTLETELRQAVDRDQWVLYYQPLVDLKTGALCGMEALLRWQHPQRGLVAPGEFIGVAEDRGLIITIGRWVLCEACRQVRAWRDAGYEVPTVSVNVSARQFGDDSLFDVIADATRRHGLPSGALSIELTESVLMSEPQRSAATLGRLADAGIAAAIDDFGTGYSSLAYLKRFAATTVKIDRSFIDGLPGSRDDLAITQAVLAMARTLGLQVVAEGVETVAQRDLLTALGCERGQGYLFGRPMPASDMERRLAGPAAAKSVSARRAKRKA